MKILIINAGSSSLKYQLLEKPSNKALIKGHVDGIGLKNCFIKYEINNTEKKINLKDCTHNGAIRLALESLINNNIIKNFREIDAVGHRVVHGGEKYSDSVKITQTVLKTIKKLFSLAPLHNPPNYEGIVACMKQLPKIPHVAVFDTAFHQTIPKKAHTYAIPYDYYKKYKIRRYGFHGTSHKYVAKQAAKIIKKPLSKLKLITCHLGNGCSITAINGGKSVDTSMGMTPVEGLIMGTRAGDIDAGILEFISDKEKKTIQQILKILNKKSGLLGISKKSSDVRILLEEQKTNKLAELALDAYTYRIAKYIGSYVATMNGIDSIIFTAGIGENAPVIRKKILNNLTYLGFTLDPKKNNKNQTTISTPNSKTKCLVIPTNEELQIANEVIKTIKKK